MTQTQTFQAGQKVRIINSTWGSSADAKRVHIGLEVVIHRYDGSDNSYSAQIDGWGVWFNPSDLQLVTDSPEPGPRTYRTYRTDDYVVILGSPVSLDGDYVELIGRIGQVTSERIDNRNLEVIAADGGTPFNPYRHNGGWHYAPGSIRPATPAEIASTSTQENTMTNTAALEISAYTTKLNQVIAAHPANGLRQADDISLRLLCREYEACGSGQDSVKEAFEVIGITLGQDTPITVADGLRACDSEQWSWVLSHHSQWQTKALQLAVVDTIATVCLAYPPSDAEQVRAFLGAGYATIIGDDGVGFVDDADAERAASDYSGTHSDPSQRIGSASRRIFSPGSNIVVELDDLSRYLTGTVAALSRADARKIVREITAQAYTKRLSASGVADVTTPINFEDDARVRVMRSTYPESYGCHNADNRRMIGTVGIVSGYRIDGACRVYLEDRSDWFMFNPSDLELVTDVVAAEPTRPSFQVGDLVRVLGSSYSGLYGCSSSGSHKMIGTVGKVRTDHDDHWAVNTPDGCDFFYFATSDLELVTEPVAAPVATTASDIITFEGEEFTKTVEADGKVVLTPYIAPPVREPQRGEVWRVMGSLVMVVVVSEGDNQIGCATLDAGNVFQEGGYRQHLLSGHGTFVAESVRAAAAAGLL